LHLRILVFLGKVRIIQEGSDNINESEKKIENTRTKEKRNRKRIERKEKRKSMTIKYRTTRKSLSITPFPSLTSSKTGNISYSPFI
jgi:hypothetical protein